MVGSPIQLKTWDFGLMGSRNTNIWLCNFLRNVFRVTKSVASCRFHGINKCIKGFFENLIRIVL